MNKKGKNPFYLNHVVSAMKTFKKPGGVTTNELINHMKAKRTFGRSLSTIVNVRNALREGVSNGIISINPERFLLNAKGNRKISNLRKTIYVHSDSTLSSDQYLKCTCHAHRLSTDAISVSSSNSSRSAHYTSIKSKKHKHSRSKGRIQKKKSKSHRRQSPIPEKPDPPDGEQPEPENFPGVEAAAVKSNLSVRALSKHDILSKGPCKSDISLGHRRKSSRFPCNSPKFSADYIN